MRAWRVLLKRSAFAFALAIAGCREPTPEANEPADTQPESLNIHDMLIDCAGAIAAEGNVDPLVEPSTGTREENALWTVLALMDKEPGLLGPAGRDVAARSKAAWQLKPEPERTARAAECMTRFGGG
jgi:hypothetical protein